MKPTTILLSASVPFALAHPLSQNQHARRAGSATPFSWLTTARNAVTTTAPPSYGSGSGSGSSFSFGSGTKDLDFKKIWENLSKLLQSAKAGQSYKSQPAASTPAVSAPVVSAPVVKQPTDAQKAQEQPKQYGDDAEDDEGDDETELTSPALPVGAQSPAVKPAAPAPVAAAPKPVAAAPKPVVAAPKPVAAAPSTPATYTPAAPAKAPTYPVASKGLWQPAVGTPFQIVLNAIIDPSTASNSRAVAYDVDLFGTPKSTIDSLKSQGKKVICYFSAGTSEEWRDDYKLFTAADKGNVVGKGDGSNWAGEKWLNIKNPNPSSATLPNVWQIQRNRIKQAADKGCDAVDPDNMDAYGNTNGMGLTKQDSIDYTRFLASEAASHGMSTGLKNAMDILPKVADVVQFAVNEQCSEYGSDCQMYSDFLQTKPVFRIEYLDDKPSGSGRLVAGVQASNINKITPICNAPTAKGMSTIFKTMDLDGWTQYCDGSTESVRLVSS